MCFECRSVRWSIDGVLFDDAVECVVDVPSGELVLWALESDIAQCHRIVVEPGVYGVVVGVAGVDRVEDEFLRKEMMSIIFVCGLCVRSG